MQLPRLSLPRFAAGDGAPTGLYVAWTVVLFLVFLVVTFPFDVLVRRALAGLQGGPVRVEFADARFAWHRGIALTGVTVHSDAAPAPLLEAESVALRPLFGQLVRGNPWAVQAHVELYGGTAEVRAHLADGRIAGELDVDAVSLGRYRPLATMLEEGRVGGRVDARLVFDAAPEAPEAGQAGGQVRLSRAALQEAKIAGFGVPDIHIDQAELDFTFQAGRVEVAKFDARGKELLLGADGQITLREPVVDSVLNLRATIMPGPEAPDAIRGLLQLVPRPAGAGDDAPLRVTGTVARPRVR